MNNYKYPIYAFVNSNGITSHNIFFTPIIPSFYLEKCVLFLNFWNLPLIYVKRTFSIYLCLKEKEKKCVEYIWDGIFFEARELSISKGQIACKILSVFCPSMHTLYSTTHLVFFLYITRNLGSLFFKIILKMKIILVNSQINFR